MKEAEKRVGVLNREGVRLGLTLEVVPTHWALFLVPEPMKLEEEKGTVERIAVEVVAVEKVAVEVVVVERSAVEKVAMEEMAVEVVEVVLLVSLAVVVVEMKQEKEQEGKVAPFLVPEEMLLMEEKLSVVEKQAPSLDAVVLFLDMVLVLVPLSKLAPRLVLVSAPLLAVVLAPLLLAQKLVPTLAPLLVLRLAPLLVVVLAPLLVVLLVLVVENLLLGKVLVEEREMLVEEREVLVENVFVGKVFVE